MADPQPRNDDLHQLVHDIRHCLHVIGMGMTLLPEVRNDDQKFAELCGTIDHERQQAAKLVDQLFDAALRQSD